MSRTELKIKENYMDYVSFNFFFNNLIIVYVKNTRMCQ